MIVGYFLGPLLVLAMTSVVASYYLTFYRTYDDIVNQRVFLTMLPLISVIPMALSNIIIGILVGKTRTKLGKARPYILMAAPLLLVSGILVFCIPYLSLGARMVWMAVTYNLFAAIANLYVNGKLVEVGPSKGDSQVWYVDEVGLLPFLKKGRNVLSVCVLRYPIERSKGCFGICRTEYPFLYVEGSVQDESGKRYSLDTCEGWFGRNADGFHIVSESDLFAPLQILENTSGALWQKGWMKPGYDMKGWESPYIYSDMNQAVSPGNLQKRTIPFLYRKERNFDKVMRLCENSFFQKDQWEKFLQGNQELCIPAETMVSVEISAGEEMTGYLSLFVEQGTGAEVKILESESYVLGGEIGDLKVPLKGDREDFQHGYLNGFTDCYKCAGYGTEDEPEIYEPFWFRTFRFIRLEIYTKSEPLTLKKFYYTETGYPLEVKTSAEASDNRFEKI